MSIDIKEMGLRIKPIGYETNKKESKEKKE